MKHPRLIHPGLGALLGLVLLVGCRSPEPVRFRTDARINDQPVRFAYDTGAEASILFERSAKRLGLKIVKPPSSADPAPGKVKVGSTGLCRFSVGGETYTVKLRTLHLPWPVSRMVDMDGIIGWPDMRDDSIAIDALSQTIRGVERAPADTNGWLRLPVYPRAGLLALQTPRADGKTGVWEVDTGNDGGVSLSPARWKEWRATHPHAHGKWTFSFMPGSGMGMHRAYKVETLSVGPLSWTNVMVCRANRTEMGFAASGDVVEGSMGVEALRSLELIVDRKGGMAYLRTRSLPALASPAPERDGPGTANASCASTVRLGFREQEYFDQATDAFDAGDFGRAFTNVTRFLQVYPDNWPALEFRGRTCYVSQRWDDAIRDFRRMGEVQPEMANYAQFYMWVIRARTGQKEAANRELAEYVGSRKKPNDDFWETDIGAFLLGRMTEAALLRATSRQPGDRSAHRCEAWFYAGMKRRLAGDTAKADDYFRKCVRTGRNDEDEYYFAAAELGLMRRAQAGAARCLRLPEVVENAVSVRLE